jgi:hypothetical protein
MACLLDFGSVVRVSDQLTITHVFKVWQAFLAFVDYRSTILSLRTDPMPIAHEENTFGDKTDLLI